MALTFTSNFTELVKIASFEKCYFYGRDLYGKNYGNFTAISGDSILANYKSVSSGYSTRVIPMIPFTTCCKDGNYYVGYYSKDYKKASNGADTLILGTGTPTDYSLGEMIENSKIEVISFNVPNNPSNSYCTVSYVMRNKSTEELSISELGYYKCIVHNDQEDVNKLPEDHKNDFVMTCYEKLETPVKVPAGAYFNLDITFTLNLK